MKKRKRGKKALSEIVGYVLLIVISISLAIGVYAWLKGMLPWNREKCPDGISIAIKEYSCPSGSNMINITIWNNGLFNIDGIVIRYANQNQTLAVNTLATIFLNDTIGHQLKPNEEYNKEFPKPASIKKLEIQAFLRKDVRRGKKDIFCEKAVIKQEVKC